MDVKELRNLKKGTSRHPWELARVKIIISLIRKAIINEETSKISIIDIGCGDLFVLESIYNQIDISEYIGIDIALKTNDINNLMSKNLDKKIKVLNNYNDIEIKEGNISLILLNDVLEHIENDKYFFNELQNFSFVNKNSIFIITVPAFQSLFCSHDKYLNHYRRYSNKQLIKAVSIENTKIYFKGYFFFNLLLPRFLKVIKERFIEESFSESTDLSTWKGGKILTSFLSKILVLDAKLLLNLARFKIIIPGLSTFIICKKYVL